MSLFWLSATEAQAKSGSKSSRSSQRTAYYQITNPNQPVILSRLKLKKGDKIISIRGQKISSQKQFRDRLYGSLKSSKPFRVQIQRSGERLWFSYQKMKDNKLIVSRIAPPSRRKLASVKSTTSKHPTRNARRSRHALPTRHARLERASINESSRSKSQSKRQLSSVAESSTSKLSSSKSPAPVKASGMKSKPAPAKTRLVPDKYKPYMQRAFVSSLKQFYL